MKKRKKAAADAEAAPLAEAEPPLVNTYIYIYIYPMTLLDNPPPVLTFCFVCVCGFCVRLLACLSVCVFVCLLEKPTIQKHTMIFYRKGHPSNTWKRDVDVVSSEFVVWHGRSYL